jgi:hypothetical protein
LPGAARFYYTDVQFEFSANGDLVFFSLKSPLDIIGEVATGNAALDMEAQFAIAEEYLSQRSFYAYSMGLESTFDHQGDPIGCLANITGLQLLGLVVAFLASSVGAYLSIGLTRFTINRTNTVGFAYYSWGLAMFLLLIYLFVS